MNIWFFWDMTLCSPVNRYPRDVQTSCLYLQEGKLNLAPNRVVTASAKRRTEEAGAQKWHLYEARWLHMV